MLTVKLYLYQLNSNKRPQSMPMLPKLMPPSSRWLFSHPLPRLLPLRRPKQRLPILPSLLSSNDLAPTLLLALPRLRQIALLLVPPPSLPQLFLLSLRPVLRRPSQCVLKSRQTAI